MLFAWFIAAGIAHEYYWHFWMHFDVDEWVFIVPIVLAYYPSGLVELPARKRSRRRHVLAMNERLGWQIYASC